MNEKLLALLISAAFVMSGIFIVKSNLLTQDRDATNQTNDNQNEQSTASQNNQQLDIEVDTNAKLIRSSEIVGVSDSYDFSVLVEKDWEAEFIEEIDAINIYNPNLSASSNLEKSQIFIRNFKASDFLTLSTVTIHERSESKINGRPIVRYDIEKKSSAKDFPSQPSWRNKRHIVTDIRASSDSPSVFYVIAKRPEIDEAIYHDFLEFFAINVSSVSLVEPVAEFKDRINKKPFGIYITPQNSPVQPEKFSGYHTGVDAEYDDVETDVPVVAVASGKVLLSQFVNGYGGVVAINHIIDNESVIAVYGHLDPASLIKASSNVDSGEKIGILGEDKSSETDGERKHLHFGIFKGNSANLRGYVAAESELKNWLNPLDLEF